MRKVGVMGGTFDPIHNGHLVAANEVKHIYDLDEVVFVPTSSQPFKVGQEMADAEHRYLMTVIATANNPDFVVSRCDIERGGVTYTFDTLKDLKSEYKEAELFFITGADSLLTLHLWQGFPELLRLAKFVGVSRQGFELNNDEKDRFETLGIDLVEVPAMAISSTDIRQRFLAERDPWYLVPDGIVQYVNKHGLYKQKS